MSKTTLPRSGHLFCQQTNSGFVLFTALVFLVLLTIIGITAMSTSNLEEKMAFNVKDRTVAFESAESALLAGEQFLFTLDNPGIFQDTANTTDGLHLVSTTPFWKDPTFWNTSSDYVSYNQLDPDLVKSGSGYAIELMKRVKDTEGSLTLPNSYRAKGVAFYRVTARGKGGTPFANSVVQSTFKKRF